MTSEGGLRRAAWLSLCVLGGCSQHVPGLELAVAEVHEGGQAAEGGGRVVDDGRGGHITLSDAWLTLSQVDILACTVAQGAPLMGDLRWSRAAEAHTEGSPTSLGVPHVASLERADGEPWTLGVLRPPPGLYCAVAITLAPADADAEGLPPEAGMVGETLHLAGSWTPAGGDPTAFDLKTGGSRMAFVVLDPALELSERAPTATLTLTLPYDQWLADAAWPQPDADAALSSAAAALGVTATR